MGCGPDGVPCGDACCDENPLQPDIGAVLQLEEMTSIPVQVKGIDSPVRTQALPRKGGSTRTITLGTTPIRILRANHLRGNVKLMSIGQAFLFCFNEGSAADPSTMAAWPAGTPYQCDATIELWVASATATTQLSVITENWAAGK